MNHLSIWLEERDLAASDVVPEKVDAYLADRRSAGYAGLLSVRALMPLLGYLRGLGVTPVPAAPVATGPLDELVEHYRRYLLEERGLAATTVRYYLKEARSFLACWIDSSGSRLGELDAARIAGFVVDECARRSVGSAKVLVTVLRSLLRFLLLNGSVSADLSGTVPAVAGWRGRHLPKGITSAEVEALLASCDRPRRSLGRPRANRGAEEDARPGVPLVAARRDRAILLLLEVLIRPTG